MLTQIIITSMTAVFSLPQLPYETNALEPVISKETIDYHYGKHLQAYVNTLNTLVKDTEYEKMNLEEIVRHAPAGPLFNNAGQVLNLHCILNSSVRWGLEARQCRKAS